MASPFQNEYEPDVVSPPGETLKETIDACGMTQAELAARTGRTRKLINEIIKGKAAITPETALQLERVLGVSADFWGNRERHYQDAVAREQEREYLANATDWLRKFPVREMRRLGWIRKLADKVAELRELLGFFGVTSTEAWEDVWGQVEVSYRKSDTFQADSFALAAWLRKGELVGQDIRCEPYDAIRFRQVLPDVRRLTTQTAGVFQPGLVQLCASCGVAVAFVPQLPKIRASGATRWLTPTKALIQVNLRYRKDDHFWFTIFHEAAHILADSKKAVFLDTEHFEGEHEQKANRFAAEQLVPQADLRGFVVSTRHLSMDAIRGFARRQGIAPGIVVGRLQHQGDLPHSYCNRLKRTLVWANKEP